jgi:phage repressor protein C with HTH and peptisase S24 domain
MAHKQRTPFTLKSGNKTSFKSMGSTDSPLREPVTLATSLIVAGASAAASAAAAAALAAKKRKEDRRDAAKSRRKEATEKSSEVNLTSETSAIEPSATTENTAKPVVNPESMNVMGGKSAGDGGLSEEEKEKLGTN